MPDQDNVPTKEPAPPPGDAVDEHSNLNQPEHADSEIFDEAVPPVPDFLQEPTALKVTFSSRNKK